jgi:hypothetical protein
MDPSREAGTAVATRKTQISRKTAETDITLTLDPDAAVSGGIRDRKSVV